MASVRNIFKKWGSGPSARASAGRACPPFFENVSYRRQFSNMSPIRPEQVVASVPHYIEQTVFDVSNWKLPLRVRFPNVPIFNSRRRTNCENFDVENKKVKYAVSEASGNIFASSADQF